MNLIYQFIKSFKLAKKRHWDKIYVAVDIHETTLKPCWYEKETYNFYLLAKQTLQLMSKDENICLILWTSCNEENAKQYQSFFKTLEINFQYVNENPECPNTDLACFDNKFYMNVGLDDKFGFIPQINWLELYLFFKFRKLF